MLVCGGCRRHVRERDASCPFCGASVRTVVAPLAIVVASVMLACGPSDGTSPGEDGEAVATMSGTTDDGGDVSTGAPDPSSTSGMGGSTDDGDDIDSDSGAGFIYGTPDLPGTFECDMFAQDCMRGEKCSPYDSPAPGLADSTACVPVPADPDPLGASCEYESSSGEDSCAAGAVCVVSGPDGTGRCEALCTGDATEPVCDGEGTACATIFDFVPVCLSACDPVETSACPDGQACVPLDAGWVCFGSVGLPRGSECEFVNVCEAGTLCADCGGSYCCTAVCDLEAEDPDAACEAPAQCVPYDDDPPDDAAHVGVCSEGA